MQPRDVLELGQVIARELVNDSRGETVSLWMSHHLAELIREVDTSDGDRKKEAEDRAVDLILRLWTNRRALPGAADPLSGYADAIRALRAILPTSNPWRRFRQGSTAEDLLSQMFTTLANFVIAGLLLTHPVDKRRIESVEWEVLSDQEKFLADMLSRWSDFVSRPSTADGDLGEFYEQLIQLKETSGDGALSEYDEPIGNEAPEDRGRAIIAHIEVMQARLVDLVAQFNLVKDAIGDSDDSDEG